MIDALDDHAGQQTPKQREFAGAETLTFRGRGADRAVILREDPTIFRRLHLGHVTVGAARVRSRPARSSATHDAGCFAAPT